METFKKLKHLKSKRYRPKVQSHGTRELKRDRGERKKKKSIFQITMNTCYTELIKTRTSVLQCQLISGQNLVFEI